MAATSEDTIALLRRRPRVLRAGRGRARARGATSRFRGSSYARRGRLPRGRREQHVLRRPQRPRPRRARAPRRPLDHARQLRSGRHLRRAGDVRRRAALGDDRDARGHRGDRDPRRRHAPPAARAPRHRGQAAVIALGRRLRETNERLARQSFQTVQSRVASVLGAARRQAQSEGAGEGDVLVTFTQATSPSWRAPRASRPAASSRCSSAPGSSPRAAGSSIVHDPAALERYVY